jgi:hypothetical protein
MRRRLLILLFSALAVGIGIAVVRLPPYIRDIHPRTVTRFLEQVEADFDSGSEHDEQNARDLIGYVEQHYPYENMDGHRGTPVAEQLAKQRQRTIEAIERWLRAKASEPPTDVAGATE